VKFSSKLIFWLSCPIILFIFLNSESLLRVFGYEFVNAEFSLRVLLIGQFFNILCGSVGYILMMTGNEKILRNIIISSALINIILNIILIPQFGILGAAIASAISMIIWNITALIYIYNKYNFSTINILK
jgi:O-antigen/teichoic acid export membrane protein